MCVYVCVCACIQIYIYIYIGIRYKKKSTSTGEHRFRNWGSPTMRYKVVSRWPRGSSAVRVRGLWVSVYSRLSIKGLRFGA